MEQAFLRAMNKISMEGLEEYTPEQQTEREKQVKGLEDYLVEANLVKFDEDLFRRVVEKVNACSMVEVEFVFKAGVEVREVLGYS